jgi:hypothetical protein
MRYCLVLFLLLASVASAQEAPYFEYTWNEGDGTVAISATDLQNFGQTVGRFEIDWTPGVLYASGDAQRSQQLLHIPNHLGLWAYDDGIHGEWFDDAGNRRLFRTRWGLPAVGVETRIVITWNAAGYAVIVDGVLRIHDWQTTPTTVFPDPDIASGAYGSRTDGSSPASGTFKLRTYDKALAYDSCTVDVVGTINEGVPLDNTGDWSQGIDPTCASPDPPDLTWQDAQLTWTAPTHNEDGTPLTDLAGFMVYYGTVDGGPYPTGIQIVDETATTHTITGLAEGTYYFVSTAYNSAGVESDFSNQVSKTIVQPPAVFSTVTTTAYGWLTFPDRLILAPIGTVPLGTPCDESQNIIDKHVVPHDQVTLSSGGADQLVILGDCQ